MTGPFIHWFGASVCTHGLWEHPLASAFPPSDVWSLLQESHLLPKSCCTLLWSVELCLFSWCDTSQQQLCFSLSFARPCLDHLVKVIQPASSKTSHHLCTHLLLSNLSPSTCCIYIPRSRSYLNSPFLERGDGTWVDKVALPGSLAWSDTCASLDGQCHSDGWSGSSQVLPTGPTDQWVRDGSYHLVLQGQSLGVGGSGRSGAIAMLQKKETGTHGACTRSYFPCNSKAYTEIPL